MRLISNITRLYDENYELIWARTWDDTKRGIDWISDLPSISPGRWAVGYNYIYIMTRILNELEPHSVLDLGLGISSTIFSQYFSSRKFDDSVHTIIEQDEEWAVFYKKKHRLSDVSDIHFCDCVEKKHKGRRYYAYDGFGKAISEKKYSVISIDGPKGSNRFSRRDIVDYIPAVLEKSFVIVIDDANRQGERDTIREIKEALRENGVEFCERTYRGLHHCCVITSEDNRFICSL